MIFEGAVTVLRYGLDFYQVCGSCRKDLFPVCHVEVFRILQGGGSREIIPADPAETNFFSLRAGFPPLRGGIKGGETFKIKERFRAADQPFKMVLLYLFAC